MSILSIFERLLDKSRIVTVGGHFAIVGGTYSAGDVISDSTTAPNNFKISVKDNIVGTIVGISIGVAGDVSTGSIIVHLFEQEVPNQNDNGTFKTLVRDWDNHIPLITMPGLDEGSDTTNSNISMATDQFQWTPIKVNGESIGVLLEAGTSGVTTPSGTTLHIKLWIRLD